MRKQARESFYLEIVNSADLQQLQSVDGARVLRAQLDLLRVEDAREASDAEVALGRS